jgi:hypothetical protein
MMLSCMFVLTDESSILKLLHHYCIDIQERIAVIHNLGLSLFLLKPLDFQIMLYGSIVVKLATGCS